MPECYLRDFVGDDDLLWVYDRVARQYRRQPPRVTAVINDYYSYLDGRGVRRVDVEQGFCQIEGMYCEVLRKLREQAELEFEDRGALSIFVALLMTRVPGFEQEVARWCREYAIDQLRRQYVEAAGRASESGSEGEPAFSVDELLAYLRDDRLAVKPSAQTRLVVVLRSALQAARLFMQMNWLFLTCSSNAAFITSDQPLAFWGPFDDSGETPDLVGLTTAGMYKVIPLTSSLCLAIGRRGPAVGRAVVDRQVVRTINNQVAANCYRFVIGPHERLVRRIVKVTGVDQTDWESRIIFPGQADEN